MNRNAPRTAALAALAMVLAAAPAPAAMQNPDTYVHAMVGDVDSLDPAFQYDGVSNAVVMQVYEPLIFYRGSSIGEFEPMLATQVPSARNGLIQSSGTVYVFPIRTGVFFHNGETLSAEDVKYSLMRYMLQDRAGGPSSRRNSTQLPRASDDTCCRWMSPAMTDAGAAPTSATSSICTSFSSTM